MTMHELLDAAVENRTVRQAIAARATMWPAELLQVERVAGVDGEHRLPPLHLAAMNDAPRSIFDTMLAVDDGAAARKRTRGRVAMHTAAQYGACTALAALHEAFEGGVRAVDADGCLPLHRAASGAAAAVVGLSRQSRQRAAVEGGHSSHDAAGAVRFLLTTYPDGVRECDFEGMLPIHHACLHRAPLAVIELLLATFAEGVRSEAAPGLEPGWTALNLAIIYGASAEVIIALLAAWPEGARRRAEAFDCLPLHFAAKHRAASASRVVELILSAHPAAAAEADAEGGRLPLHVAVANTADERSIAVLLAAHPAAAATPDEDGALPLHTAVSSEASAAVVQRLLLAYPEAVGALVKGGLLPLHLAVSPCRHGLVMGGRDCAPFRLRIQLEGLSRLRMHPCLQQAPMPVHAYASHGCRTHQPVAQVAAQVKHGAPVEVIALLLHTYPQAAMARSDDGSLPLHMAAEAGDDLWRHALSHVRLSAPLWPPSEAALTVPTPNPRIHVCAGMSAAAISALLQSHPAAARSRTRFGKLPLQLVAKRGFVDTDAEDVSTRRSTSGLAAGLPGGGGVAESVGGEQACVHGALVRAFSYQLSHDALVGTTWRAEAVVTGGGHHHLRHDGWRGGAEQALVRAGSHGHGHATRLW